MRDDYHPDNVIPRPEGPKKRPPLHPYYPQTVSEMGKKKSPNKNSRNRSHNSTPNSSNTSKSSPSTPEQNLRRRTETGGKPKLYPDLTELENCDTESSGSSPGKSNFSLESITDSFDSSESDKTLNGSKLSEASFESKRKAEAIGEINRSKEERSQSSGWVSLTLTIIALILGYYGLSNLLSKEREDKFDLKSSISDLRLRFPSQDKDIWSNFGSGIADVQSETLRPAIFLLLANHTETTNCLAKRVAEVARSALGGTGEVTLALEKLSNISQVFKLMENHLNQTKAVVLFDILSLHPEALKAFHDICDQYTSLVPEAVYLFTMRAPRLSGGFSNPVNIAEEQLKNKFSKYINEDTLKALIARITAGGVLSIKAEERIPCSE